MNVYVCLSVVLCLAVAVWGWLFLFCFFLLCVCVSAALSIFLYCVVFVLFVGISNGCCVHGLLLCVCFLCAHGIVWFLIVRCWC